MESRPPFFKSVKRVTHTPVFYAITNPSNGKAPKSSRARSNDFEDSGSVGIPGELKGEIWDSFQDL